MSMAALGRRGMFVAFAVAVCLAAPSFALAGTGEVNFFLGGKSLKSSDWKPLEDQAEFGAEISFGGEDWPVLIAIDVFGSATEERVSGMKFEGTTSELGVGVRKIWEVNRTRPYVGGGLAMINAELEGASGGSRVKEDDNGLGGWVGGGVFWRLGSRFNIGLSVRYSKASVNVFGVDAEAGGTHAGLLLGWGWPAAR